MFWYAAWRHYANGLYSLVRCKLAHLTYLPVKRMSLQKPWCLKGAVSRYSVIFCAFFAWGKMATAHASVADIRSWQLGQPREQLHHPSWVAQMSFSSRKCCFPRPSLVAAIIFPHAKWLPKITDYRDTAALITCLNGISFVKLYKYPFVDFVFCIWAAFFSKLVNLWDECEECAYPMRPTLFTFPKLCALQCLFTFETIL